MKTSFFILLRYFLRVDGSKAKMMDTRYFHETNTNYILKEHTVREAMLSEVNLPTEILTNPVELAPKLPLVKEQFTRLDFPNS